MTELVTCAVVALVQALLALAVCWVTVPPLGWPLGAFVANVITTCCVLILLWTIGGAE